MGACSRDLARVIHAQMSWTVDNMWLRQLAKREQKHYVEPKGHEGAHIRVVLLNVFAFLLTFVTLMSPPPDENHYCL